MSKTLLIAGGIAALVAVSAVGAVIANNNGAENAVGESISAAVSSKPKEDCRIVATRETGFDPATTPVPVREDAGNKQVLKGTAAGAAFGAVAGEVIGDRAGLGAAAGAAAGAAGGQAVKADRQNSADARFEQDSAAYAQQKAAYDAALQNCLG